MEHTEFGKVSGRMYGRYIASFDMSLLQKRRINPAELTRIAPCKRTAPWSYTEEVILRTSFYNED